MRKTLFFGILFVTFLYFVRPTYAQQTFGPTCEVGVTCTPTPRPTSPPAPSPKVPVTGTVEVTLAVVGLGGLFLVSGLVSLISFQKASVEK